MLSWSLHSKWTQTLKKREESCPLPSILEEKPRFPLLHPSVFPDPTEWVSQIIDSCTSDPNCLRGCEAQGLRQETIAWLEGEAIWHFLNPGVIEQIYTYYQKILIPTSIQTDSLRSISGTQPAVLSKMGNSVILATHIPKVTVLKLSPLLVLIATRGSGYAF